MFWSEHNSDRAIELSKEALVTARQANDIATGRVREVPAIEIYELPQQVRFITSRELTTTTVDLGVKNVAAAGRLVFAPPHPIGDAAMTGVAA